MEYVIVAFRVRAHTVKFYEFLIRNGVYSEIVNTPKEAGVGCGLSVRVSLSSVGAIKNAVRITGLSSFAGVFKVSSVGERRTVKSI